MKFLSFAKDGGPESHVTGFFLIEIKSLFSVVILQFKEGTREAYHSHAFNALTFWLTAAAYEEFPNGKSQYWSGGKWKFTPRNLMHRVRAIVDSYALSFRGPWKDTWEEYSEATGKTSVLTHGRLVIDEGN